jgi:hypothetical protein
MTSLFAEAFSLKLLAGELTNEAFADATSSDALAVRVQNTELPSYNCKSYISSNMHLLRELASLTPMKTTPRILSLILPWASTSATT